VLTQSLTKVHKNLTQLGKRLGLPSHQHQVTIGPLSLVCSLSQALFSSVSLTSAPGLIVESRDLIARDIPGDLPEESLRGLWEIDGVKHTLVALTRKPTSYEALLRPLADRRGGPLL
jgi:hypothetical protein